MAAGQQKNEKHGIIIKEYKTVNVLPEERKYQTPAEIVLLVKCLKFRQF